MRSLVKTLIPTGMILACACGASNQAAREVNPPPAFAIYEPTRAPLGPWEGTTEPAIAQGSEANAQGSSMRIVAGPEPEKPQELQPVHFAFGSAYIDVDERDRLAEYAAWLKSNPQQQVLIEGHTDAAGPTEYNFELGEQRALAVRDFLIQLGVEPERMQVVSRGEEEPVSQDQAELNRRSEVVPMQDSISMQQR